MSLIQQFLEENLTRDLNHQLLAQIQEQNSAVESLVGNLQGLRDKQNLQSIGNKIKRIEEFMQLKKQVITTLQPLNPNPNTIFQWLLDTLINNSFLYQLIKRQQFFVQKQLVQMGKKVLLGENYLQQHHEDSEFAMKIVRELQLVGQEKGQGVRNVGRERIKQIDYGVEVVEEKIKMFEERVGRFNMEMVMFLRKIYQFDEKIRNEFYQHFKTQPYQPQTPTSNHSVKKGFTRQNSQKSHISIDSHNNRQSSVKLIRPQQFYQAQRTPRKFLQTQGVQATEQKTKGYERKSVIEKKRLTIDDRRSSQTNEIKSLIQQNRGSTIQNKRSTIDYYKKNRPSERYDPSQIDELKSMNKALSTLNYYNRSEGLNMMYTMSNLGQQVRLPTKWAANSRSSISYNPLR